ncbi:MAG: oligoendopeptidase [Thermoanaerobaculia bacterium]|nr:oligoendopeptidase [Thermoanaerobaculia bacterium]
MNANLPTFHRYLNLRKRMLGLSDLHNYDLYAPLVANAKLEYYIPHFYRTYYVYQYATSATASAALSEKVMSGDANATKRYLAFLSAGGSKYPIDLLKDAGVDMTTSEPLDLTMKKMNRVMDEMDAILKQMGK